MKNRGREFEKLVTDIEKAFSGTDAIIKQNDRIPDMETGKLREVDISIRSKSGSMNFLVIIECRDRKVKADARWIEELDGKRKSIHADKVIAVSRSGFTPEAIQKAKIRNIETRTLKKLKQHQIKEWIEANPFNVYHLTGTHLGGNVTFHVENNINIDFLSNFQWSNENGTPKKSFVLGNSIVKLNPFKLFSLEYIRIHGEDPDVNVKEGNKELWLSHSYDEGELWLCDDDWKVSVKHLNIGFELNKQNINLKELQRYETDNKNLAHLLKWEDQLDHDGTSIPITIEATLSSI